MPAGASAHLRFSPRPNRAREIAWRPFGPAAFAEARRLGRPLLLAIGAVWCHWCHVMDETTYSDSGVLEAIATGCVAVRVDRDLRPDVDRRYNQGGWPTTCLFNANGSLLWGATYVPPERLRDALTAVREAYARDPSLALALPPARPAAARERAAAAAAPAAVVEAVLRAAAAAEDRRHGGFGQAGPKFPQAEVLAFLAALAPWPDGRARTAEGILDRALDGMLAGALEDPVEGGFYRYATRSNWREPHYEKMLLDNALLASLYLRAGARTGEARWLEAGRRTLAFLDRVFWQEDLTAYAMSEDADAAYARADRAERVRLGRPGLDRVIYADANLAMVETLLDGWAILGDDRARLRAIALSDGLVARLYRPDKGFGHADAGGGPDPAAPAEGMDAARGLSAALALLPLGREVDGARACALADGLVARIDATGRLTEGEAAWPGPESFGRSPAPPLIAESGLAATCLAGLGRRLERPEYLNAARRLIAAHADDVPSLGLFAAELGRAAFSLREGWRLEIRPGRDPATTLAFVAAARRAGVDAASTVLGPPAPRDGEAVAYPCLGTTCAEPVTHPAALVGSVSRLVAATPPQLVW